MSYCHIFYFSIIFAFRFRRFFMEKEINEKIQGQSLLLETKKENTKKNKIFEKAKKP